MWIVVWLRIRSKFPQPRCILKVKDTNGAAAFGTISICINAISLPDGYLRAKTARVINPPDINTLVGRKLIIASIKNAQVFSNLSACHRSARHRLPPILIAALVMSIKNIFKLCVHICGE